jgi:putative membrane protein insertion efficiency factor
MQKLTILLIRCYRYCISPFLGSHCRYHPSCSSYALTALQRFGFAKGSVLSLKRISRCHPWHSGGYDPVPELQTQHNSQRPEPEITAGPTKKS